jgi:hypothetical protein
MAMRQHRLAKTASSHEASHFNGKGRRADPIEEVQLRRLAGAVLSKSPADLAALAESNPMIVWEWIEAFRHQKHAAEIESRYWTAAMAALATANPEAVRTAAE